MSDAPTPPADKLPAGSPANFPPSEWTKDNAYPLLSVIQALCLWGKENGIVSTFDTDGSPAYAAGKVYSTTFTVTCPRILDWNMPAQMDWTKIEAIEQYIIDYLKNMKPAAS